MIKILLSTRTVAKKLRTRSLHATFPIRSSIQSDLMNKIIKDPARAIEIAGKAKVVAVLGIRPSTFASKPAHFVPAYLQETGIDIIPVPTHPTNETTILGKPIVKSLKDIKQHVDIIDIFRRGEDLPQHVDDILNMNPRPTVVWLQSGISNEEVEKTLADAGIEVVVSRCLKVDRGAAGHYARF